MNFDHNKLKSLLSPKYHALWIPALNIVDPNNIQSKLWEEMGFVRSHTSRHYSDLTLPRYLPYNTYYTPKCPKWLFEVNTGTHPLTFFEIESHPPERKIKIVISILIDPHLTSPQGSNLQHIIKYQRLMLENLQQIFSKFQLPHIYIYISENNTNIAQLINTEMHSENTKILECRPNNFTEIYPRVHEQLQDIIAS